MPSSATSGSGCSIKRYNGSSYVDIPEVKGVRGPGLSGGTVDVTSFESANDVREFITTLRDAGTVSFTCNYLPANATQSSLLTDLRDGIKTSYRITFSNSGATTCTFDAVVTQGEISAELEAALSLSVTLKVSGWPVWA